MKYLLVVCLLLSPLSLFAQQAEKTRTCRILFVERPSGAPSKAFLFDGKTSYQVSLPSMNFGEVIELPPGDITIGMTSQPVSDPELFPSDAPTAKIPEHFQHIYLLVVSDSSNKQIPVRLKLINIDNNQFKAGQTLWINLTKHRIAAKLGSKQLFIPPMKRSVSDEPMSSSGYFKAQFFYQPQGTDQFYPVMRKSWWHDATSKNLGFIIGTHAKLPKIFTLRDRRPIRQDREKTSP